jgi:hypothetical protein
MRYFNAADKQKGTSSMLSGRREYIRVSRSFCPKTHARHPVGCIEPLLEIERLVYEAQHLLHIKSNNMTHLGVALMEQDPQVQEVVPSFEILFASRQYRA